VKCDHLSPEDRNETWGSEIGKESSMYLSDLCRFAVRSVFYEVRYFIQLKEFVFRVVSFLDSSMRELANLFEGACPNSIYISNKYFRVLKGILKSYIRSWSRP
jgi:hypothetical protein